MMRNKKDGYFLACWKGHRCKGATAQEALDATGYKNGDEKKRKNKPTYNELYQALFEVSELKISCQGVPGVDTATLLDGVLTARTGLGCVTIHWVDNPASDMVAIGEN